MVSQESVQGLSREPGLCPGSVRWSVLSLSGVGRGGTGGSVRGRSSESGVCLGAMPGQSGVGLVSVWGRPGGKSWVYQGSFERVCGAETTHRIQILTGCTVYSQCIHGVSTGP